MKQTWDNLFVVWTYDFEKKVFDSHVTSYKGNEENLSRVIGITFSPLHVVAYKKISNGVFRILNSNSQVRIFSTLVTNIHQRYGFSEKANVYVAHDNNLGKIIEKELFALKTHSDSINFEFNSDNWNICEITESLRQNLELRVD